MLKTDTLISERKKKIIFFQVRVSMLSIMLSWIDGNVENIYVFMFPSRNDRSPFGGKEARSFFFLLFFLRILFHGDLDFVIVNHLLSI